MSGQSSESALNERDNPPRNATPGTRSRSRETARRVGTGKDKGSRVGGEIRDPLSQHSHLAESQDLSASQSKDTRD